MLLAAADASRAAARGLLPGLSRDDAGRFLPTYVDTFQDVLLRNRLIAHTYSWSELLRQTPNPGIALVGVLGALQGVLGALGALVTVLVLPYYLLLEAPALQVAFVRLFAREHRAMLARVIHSVTVKVSAWLGGQLLLSGIIGTTAALSVLELSGAERAGTAEGWTSDAYQKAVKKVSRRVAAIRRGIQSQPEMNGTTLLVVTGTSGAQKTKGSSRNWVESYRVPMFITGPGVPAASDLYGLNPSRAYPGKTQVGYSGPQPIRLGDLRPGRTRVLGRVELGTLMTAVGM